MDRVKISTIKTMMTIPALLIIIKKPEINPKRSA